MIYNRSIMKNRWGYRLMVMPLLIVLFLITGIPLLQSLFSSFYSDSYGVREWIGLKGYRFVLQDSALRMTVNITLLWDIGSVIGTLLCAYLIAEKMYSSAKRAWPVFGALLVSWAIPVFISVPLWRALLYGNGGESLISVLTGISIPLTSDPAAAFFASIVVSIWLGLPFPTLVIYSNLKKINRAMLDAASLDGCSRWNLNRWILAPLLREPLVVLIVLSAMGSFKEFSMMYMLTAGGPPLVAGITDNFIVGATSTIGIFLYQTFSGFNDYGITAVFGIMLAAGVGLIMLFWMILRIKNTDKRMLYALLFSLALHLIWFRSIYWFTIPAVVVVIIGSRKYRLLELHLRRFLALLCIIELADILLVLRSEHLFTASNPPLLFTLFLLLLAPRIPGKSLFNSIIQSVRRPRIFSSAGSGKFPGFIYRLLQEIIIWLFILSSVCIVYLLFWLSFSQGNVCSFTGFIPPFPSLEAYGRIFSEFHLHRALLNTLLIALPAAILVPCVVVPGAYALSRIPRKQSDRWLAAIQTLGTAGGIHTLIPLFTIVGILGLLDTRTAVIVLYVGHAIPKSVLILKAFFQDIPHSLYETAAIEGCSFGTYLRKILLPLTFPAVITIMMTSFLSAWNGFLVPLLFLGTEQKFPISITLFRFVGSGDSGNPLWSLFAAASIVNMVIVGGLFFVVKKPLERARLSEYRS
jgi:multiple sugar transport system permease protein